MSPCKSCDKNMVDFQQCPSCYTLINQTEFKLLPKVINEIEIQNPNFPNENEIKTCLDSSFIIEITHHISEKPWYIPNRYYFYNQQKKSIILPIITSKAATVPIGETLCQYRFICVSHILLELGKKVFICFSIKH